MSKDPAFLFYSKDFYEGTRTMLPEERACYIDLLIYQHQHNGFIPDNFRRILLYCNGINEATLKATLKAKFKLDEEKGWYNNKLNIITTERHEYSKKQSLNGIIGQFWKKSKTFLNTTQYNKLRKKLSGVDKQQIVDFIKNKEINHKTLKDLLHHLAIEDANANEDIYKNIRLLFNKTCTELQPILKITDYRKNSIDFLIQQYKPENIEDFFLSAFRTVKSSKFLNGGGKKGFLMTFDWMLKPDNFIKIIEGNYDDTNSNNTSTDDDNR